MMYPGGKGARYGDQRRAHPRGRVAGYIFSFGLGALAAASLLLLVARSRTPSELKHSFVAESRRQVAALAHTSPGRVVMGRSRQFTVPGEFGEAATCVVFGGWGGKSPQWSPSYYVAIFEPARENLLDRVAARGPRYRATSFTAILGPAPDILEALALDAVDLDDDGTDELVLQLHATWADGVSKTPLIYRRDGRGAWDLIYLPSIVAAANAAYRALEDTTQPGQPLRPVATLGPRRGDVVAGLRPFAAYEDEFVAVHNGETLSFFSLRNGGDYSFRRHQVKGHCQVAAVCPLSDDEGALCDHHLLIMFYALAGGRLQPDSLWNWGFPIVTTVTMAVSDLDLDAVDEAGIAAHSTDHAFFGHTQFQRRR